jgi:hypothetical protein
LLRDLFAATIDQAVKYISLSLWEMAGVREINKIFSMSPHPNSLPGGEGVKWDAALNNAESFLLPQGFMPFRVEGQDEGDATEQSFLSIDPSSCILTS